MDFQPRVPVFKVEPAKLRRTQVGLLSSRGRGYWNMNLINGRGVEASEQVFRTCPAGDPVGCDSRPHTPWEPSAYHAQRRHPAPRACCAGCISRGSAWKHFAALLLSAAHHAGRRVGESPGGATDESLLLCSSYPSLDRQNVLVCLQKKPRKAFR